MMLTKEYKPGIYPGLSFQEYAAISAVNNSLLWKLKRWSPLHARYERDHPTPPTADQFFGQVLHARVLEPAEWEKRHMVKPECDRRTKEGKAIYAEFCEARGDKEEVKPEDYEKVVQIEQAIRSAMCSNLVKGGRNELCLVWDDPETGVRMKARCDCVHEDPFDGDVIVDFKTTASARDDDFEQSIYKWGYFMQAAIYCAGWEVLTGNTPEFTILAVEKTPPFAWADFPLGPKTLDAGKLAFRQCLHQYIECEKSGYWPGYRRKNATKQFFEMSSYHLGTEGVSTFQEHAEPMYVSGDVPGGQDRDEFDDFLKRG